MALDHRQLILAGSGAVLAAIGRAAWRAGGFGELNGRKHVGSLSIEEMEPLLRP